MGNIFAAYIADRREDGKDVSRMESAWKPLKPQFGHLAPDQIDKPLCRAYIKLRRGLGVTNGGIKTEMDYLSTALRFGRAAKLYTGDIPEIHRPPAGRPREKWLTREQARKLIDGAVAFHVKLWLHLALATAGRPSHILQLTWDRVELRLWKHPETGVTYYGSVNLDDPERDATQKGRARVPLTPEAYEALQLARPMATGRYVVEMPNPNGLRGDGPIKSVSAGIARAAERAGVDASPYTIRHTAGVWMAQRRVPMIEISRYMGHTNPATTYRYYAHHHPDHLQEAAAALSLREEPKAIEDKRGEGE